MKERPLNHLMSEGKVHRMVRLACRAAKQVKDDDCPHVFLEVLREHGYIVIGNNSLLEEMIPYFSNKPLPDSVMEAVRGMEPIKVEPLDIKKGIMDRHEVVNRLIAVMDPESFRERGSRAQASIILGEIEKIMSERATERALRTLYDEADSI